MASLRLIKRIFGFGFIFFGIFWILIDKYNCRYLCRFNELNQSIFCVWVFIFVGIIFIVSGASLLILENIAPELTL